MFPFPLLYHLLFSKLDVLASLVCLPPLVYLYWDKVGEQSERLDNILAVETDLIPAFLLVAQAEHFNGIRTMFRIR